jgi:hypothetical protein
MTAGPRAADDFAAIRARMEELQRERAWGMHGRAVDASQESRGNLRHEARQEQVGRPMLPYRRAPFAR